MGSEDFVTGREKIRAFVFGAGGIDCLLPEGFARLKECPKSSMAVYCPDGVVGEPDATVAREGIGA